MPSWLRRSLMALAALALIAVGLQAYSIVPATFGTKPRGLPADPRRTNFNGGGHRWPVQYYSNHLPTLGGPG